MNFTTEEKILLGFAAAFAAVSLGVYFSLNFAGIGLEKIGNANDQTQSVYNIEKAGDTGVGMEVSDSPVKEPEKENDNAVPPKQEQGKPSQKYSININTADAEELQNIVGVGEVIAHRIVDYRIQNGAFKTVEEIMNVKGIGKATFEKMKDSIAVK